MLRGDNKNEKLVAQQYSTFLIATEQKIRWRRQDSYQKRRKLLSL